MYFCQKLTLTSISKELDISTSYVSKILRNNNKYQEEKERRKQETLRKRRKQQKKMISELRKDRVRQNFIENQIVRNEHNQAAKELSKGRSIGKEALRKWCSFYTYDKQKKCYVFENKEIKPRDFPLYLNI